jgi:hypothetical protein
VALSTCLCSLLILSISCHLTKSLCVLLSTQTELFPWLRAVPVLTLFFGFSLMACLPVWTAAVIWSHARHSLSPAVHQSISNKESVLGEDSPVFVTFVVMVAVLTLTFLFFYYKAYMRLRSIRIKVDSGKHHILDYR